MVLATLKRDRHARECPKAGYQTGIALQGKSYHERLKSLGLSSLECRRLRNYKIVRDIDKVDKDKLFTINNDTRTRGHKYKLFKRKSRLYFAKMCLVTELSILGTFYLTV